MIETVLCVDNGTTSLKAALISANGEVVSFSNVYIPDPQSDYVAQNWYTCFIQAAMQIREDVKEKNQRCLVKGLSVSGNGPTVVTDQGLTYLWNRPLQSVQIPENCASSLFLPKILSLREKYPYDFERSQYIFSGPEYFIYKLTGNAVTILPEKRFESAYWTKDICNQTDLSIKKFPAFVPIAHNCGDVKSSLMSGLENDYLFYEFNLPVFAGGPDFVVALIGTNTLQPGRLCDRCGSSEGFNFCVDKYLSDPELRTLPSVIPGLWNLSYLIPESGNMDKDQKMEEIKKAFEYIKQLFAKNKMAFPQTMALTGGQTEDYELAKEKEELLNIKITIPNQTSFNHNELLGDACAAFTGLGVFDNLVDAASSIVKEKPLV